MVTGLSVAGYVALFTGGPRGPFRDFSRLRPRSTVVWPVAAAVGVFFVFGAPVILSGSATFAGYIKLDDTSTWLAFTDHVLAHGHSVGGLAPSSYEATIQINLSAGYPLGAFIPLGVGHELTGQDSAWLFQPYMALMAAFMSLVFYELAAPVIRDHRLRAAAIFIAAQPALLVGYAFWGGIKEVATALLVSILAAGSVELARDPKPRSAVVVPILAGAALIGVMGAGGLPWLAAILGGAAFLMLATLWKARRDGGEISGPVKAMLVCGFVALAGIAVIGLPTVFAGGQLFSPNQGPLTSSEEMGNLIRPLSLAQYPGPWPVGDFRVEPVSSLASLLTSILVFATVVAAGFGLVAALVRRAWGLLLLTFGTGLGSFLVWLVGSPWVQGKALATGSASFLILAMAGIGYLLGAGSKAEVEGEVEGRSRPFAGISTTGLRAIGAVLLIVPCGILVSSALAYHETWLAPKAQLAELSEIGQEFKGEGPALMTEYQAYGVRHFLRLLDAEGASELRRRVIPRLDGTETEKGAWSDTDELVMDPGQQGVLTYRTLVLRRNPRQSRPPSPYKRVWQGKYYEVWQRDPDYDAANLIVHKPLGGDFQPAAVPNCAVVQSVATEARNGNGKVVAAERQPNAVADLTSYPPDWVPDPANKTLTPLSDGTATGSITVPKTGRYQVWVGGSARGRVSVEIGGQDAGSALGLLNNNAQFISLADLDFEAGSLPVTLSYEKGGNLRPATGGYPFGIGPVVLEPVAEPEVVTVTPADAQKLCGRSLDWIEAVR
ncbi:MAG: hypothetical protein KDB54_11845 [Solirubrobacterales bacterium]|nr:hypothetical protein [Solirubrobacterales bacterium]